MYLLHLKLFSLSDPDAVPSDQELSYWLTSTDVGIPVHSDDNDTPLEGVALEFCDCRRKCCFACTSPRCVDQTGLVAAQTVFANTYLLYFSER